MQVLYTRCAGLDVHKATIVACVRCVSPPLHQEVRRFGTTTAELLRLADWLAEHGCTHVAMEATGVGWKPVWHVLEAEFEPVLANASHIRNVPGRKADVNDAMWIADLLAHGLIRSSFVPPQVIQQLRDFTRTRKQLVREVSQHSLRIQKVLEDANLKLGSALSDVLGKSGRAMLDAIVAGEADPARLAALAQGTARNKTAELRARCVGASPSITARCCDCICRCSSLCSARWPNWMRLWEKRWRRSNSAPACRRRCPGYLT
jgi:transposase